MPRPSAAIAASWEMDEGPDVVWPWILAVAVAKCCGAARYPRRQPVMAKALENPLTVSVRSRMPGMAAKEKCFAGS